MQSTPTPITPQDYPRLLDIQFDCIQGLTNVYKPEELQRWIKYLEADTANRYAKFHNLACRNEASTIVAFTSWSNQDSTTTIECLYVLENYRGRGLGSRLLEAAEAALPLNEIRVRSSLNARPFYEKHGYRFTKYATSNAGFKVALLEKSPSTNRQPRQKTP